MPNGLRPVDSGQGMDHVTDPAVNDAIVHIAQDPGQEHSEQELIEPSLAADGEQVGQECNGPDGNRDKKPSLPLTQPKHGATVFGVGELKPIGDDRDNSIIEEIFDS